jgi:hypothetical protein
MPNARRGIEYATWRNQRRSLPVHAARPIGAVARSDGVRQSANCCRYRPPIGWQLALPDSLRASSTAEALEAIVELDVTDLAGVEPPHGYGRD